MKKVYNKIGVLKMKEVERLIFEPVLKRLHACKEGNKLITSWFQPLK
jgi:hypothetical protein